MSLDLFDNQKLPGYGECIYCGVSADDAELTDEHVVPYSLGGNVEILKASCKACAAETSRCEREIAKKVFDELRLHVGAPTRRPKRRPSELPFTVSIEGAPPKTLTVPIEEQPFFTPMPVWGMPGILCGAQPSTSFPIENKAHVFSWIPPNAAHVIGLARGQKAEIPIPAFYIDHFRFARAIAKIAYCQAVIRYGLHGFRRLMTPAVILGRYPFVPYFVGSDPDATPPPPIKGKVLHAIELETVGIGNLRLIEGSVRLFANSGTENEGPPIYRVIVGAPPVSRRGQT
jgi:hypothetical protein